MPILKTFATPCSWQEEKREKKRSSQVYFRCSLSHTHIPSTPSLPLFLDLFFQSVCFASSPFSPILSLSLSPYQSLSPILSHSLSPHPLLLSPSLSFPFLFPPYLEERKARNPIQHHHQDGIKDEILRAINGIQHHAQRRPRALFHVQL